MSPAKSSQQCDKPWHAYYCETQYCAEIFDLDKALQ